MAEPRLRQLHWERERERGGALTYRESPETCFFFCVCVSVDLGGNIKWWFRLEAKDSGRQRTYCRANKLLVKWRNERDNEPDLFLRPLGIFSMPASWRKSTPGLLGNNINFTFKKKNTLFRAKDDDGNKSTTTEKWLDMATFSRLVTNCECNFINWHTAGRIIWKAECFPHNADGQGCCHPQLDNRKKKKISFFFFFFFAADYEEREFAVGCPPIRDNNSSTLLLIFNIVSNFILTFLPNRFVAPYLVKLYIYFGTLTCRNSASILSR